MLERRRKNKHYDIVPGEEDGDLGDGERDVELGEGQGLGAQESGTISAERSNGYPTTSDGVVGKTNVTEELDNWDENEEDWEEEGAEAAKVVAGVGAEEEPTKKRTD